jgi:hypothetical protein
MRYAQFYHASTGYSEPVGLTPMCGSDGVLPLDGRIGDARAESLAREAGGKRGALAFRLWAGESFTRSRPCGRLVRLGDCQLTLIKGVE